MSTEPKVDPYKGQNKKRRRKPSKRAVRLAPQKFELISNLREDYIPLRDRLGSYVNAQPYAWISLDDGGERDKALFEFGVSEGKQAIREGLTSLSIKNEKGTLPQIDFEVICPTALNTDGRADDRIDTIKRGTRLYVFFGYTHAISRQGYYIVKNKSVDYSEGVIRLKITAIMGHRLNMTTTSNIIRAGGAQYNVLDRLASIGDHEIDYTDLLDEEIAKIKEMADSKGANMTVGQRLWHHVTHLDIDFWINPKNNKVTLATPYTYDLKELGKFAVKLTYGLPNSNIRRISYNEKLVSKKNSGKKSTALGNTQSFAGGSVNEDTLEGKILRHGYIRIGNTSNFLPIGDPSQFARHVIDAKNKGPNDLTEAEFFQKYSDTKRWITEVDNDFNLDVTRYTQYKVKEIVKGLNILEENESGTVSLEKYRQLVTEGKYVVITGITGTSISDAQLTVDVFSKGRFKATPKKQTKASKNKSKPGSSTVKTGVNKQGEIVEVLEQYKIITVPPGRNAPMAVIREQRLAELKKLRDAGVTEDGRSIKITEGKPDPLTGIVKYTITAVTKKEAIPVRENPAKPEVDKSDNDTNEIDNTPKGKEEVASNSNDGMLRSRRDPSSKGGRSGNGNKISRRSEKELTIELAGGDWTLPLGTVIELIDVNDSVSGFYVVNSEEHRVGGDGFITTIKCSVGISKKKIKKTSSSRSGTTRKDASNLASGLVRVRRKQKPKQVSEPSPFQKDMSNRTRQFTTHMMD